MQFDFSVKGRARVTMQDYINDCLRHYEVTETVTTPATNNLFKNSAFSSPLSAEKAKIFHSRVAKLAYLARRVRPDILTAIAFLSTRVQSATDEDWSKLDRVLKYLNGCPHLGIVLCAPDGLQVSAEIDASYAVHDDFKSQSGVVISFGRHSGPVYVSSKKQKLNTISSTEAELVAVADGATQLLWIRELLAGQGHTPDPAILFQDNTSTIRLHESGKSCSQRTRHINVRYFFVKDRIDARELVVQYLPTKEMRADLLTKPLQGVLFQDLRDSLHQW
jgi:hypothetical protein